MRPFMRGALPLIAACCITTAVTLALTPKERKLVERALSATNTAISHDQDRSKEVEAAKAEAEAAQTDAFMATRSANAADQRAEHAEAKAGAQDEELKRCATENAKMRDIVEAVSGPWWFPGLNALIYAIKKSVLSLIVILAIFTGIGLLLKFCAPEVLTALKLAGSTVIAFVKTILSKLKPKPKE